MRISRLQESVIMCNEPGCTLPASFLVDSRSDESSPDPSLFAAYCHKHVQRFRPPEKAEASRSTAAVSGGGQGRKLA